MERSNNNHSNNNHSYNSNNIEGPSDYLNECILNVLSAINETAPIIDKWIEQRKKLKVDNNTIVRTLVNEKDCKELTDDLEGDHTTTSNNNVPTGI